MEATQINLDSFYEYLKEEYTRLFREDPEYMYPATITTPASLARSMTLSLDNGTANKDGKAVKNACKYFSIPHTYKAIREFLDAK